MWGKLFSKSFPHTSLYPRKPPAVPVVPKSFSFAQFPPQRKAPLCKGSWTRSGLRGCTHEKLEKTIPPSRQAVPPPFTQGRLKRDRCHICGSGATSASGGLFDEPIGSACEMPRGGCCKPPERPVVMTSKNSTHFLWTTPPSFSCENATSR